MAADEFGHGGNVQGFFEQGIARLLQHIKQHAHLCGQIFIVYHRIGKPRHTATLLKKILADVGDHVGRGVEGAITPAMCHRRRACVHLIGIDEHDVALRRHVHVATAVKRLRPIFNEVDAIAFVHMFGKFFVLVLGFQHLQTAELGAMPKLGEFGFALHGVWFQSRRKTLFLPHRCTGV